MKTTTIRGAPRILALYLIPFLCAGADTAITLTDYTGRGFAPDVVTYSIALKRDEASKLRLLDAQNQPSAFQITEPDSAGPSPSPGQALLSFITGLPANSNVTFTLRRDGQGPAGSSALKVVAEGATLVLDNGLCAVKLPAQGSKTFNIPVAANTLPAPILAFRGDATLPWWGAGKVLSERKVSALRVTILARGPVFADVRYELDYEGGGYYRAIIRLADRVPMARVSEEYDLGRMAGSNEPAERPAGRDWRSSPIIQVVEPDLWEIELTRGWQPDMVEKANAWGNGGGGDTGVYIPLADFKPSFLMNAGAHGVDRISVFGLFRAADTNAGAAYPGVGITPLHNGFWRRAMNLELARPGPEQVALRLPMTRSTPRWVETSPFCVASHDPDKPYTYARRQWGLVLNALPVTIKAHYGQTPACRTYQARLTYGNVGLDRYKDFILDWPDSKPSYPRVFMKAAQIQKYRDALTPDNPLTRPMTNRSHALAPRDAPPKSASFNFPLQKLQNLVFSAIGFAAQSHHACCDAGSAMTGADDALGFPGLTADQRKALRARLALLAYLFTDPDINGQGSGSHTGNPNMSLARQAWVSTAIAMLPDHPMYAAWRDYMTAWTAFKFADNMAPGGGWFEPGTYQEWGYQRMIWSVLGLEAMKAKGLEHVRAYHLADSDFYMNLLTPFDPRWCARMIPGFGNNATHYTSMWLDAAAAAEAARPDLASELMWAWRANGTQLSDAVPAMARPWIQPREPALASRCFPGFGIVFRAHQGPEETYLLFRSGYLWSHWTVDQGNVALYSRGAVLLPPQPYTYFSSKFPEHSQENDIRFGHPANEFRFGWPDSNILDYRFGERVQYAWASAGYPAWFITPGIAEGFGEGPKLQPGPGQKEGAFWWDRQVAFMVGKTAKSPNYFLFHDSVTGDGKLAQWLNFDFLGRASNVQAQGNRLNVSTEWPVALDIAFADQRALAPTLTEEDQLLNVQYNIYGPTWAAATKGKPVSPNWRRSDGKPADQEKVLVPDIERHVLARIPAAPGADHFWLAYPRALGEAAPTLERLASNVVKVVHTEGSDYLLLAATHDRYEGQDVVLEGQAAALRVSADSVTFALLGGAGRAGYKGQVFEGVGGFERTLPLRELKPGTTTIAAPKQEKLPIEPGLKKHQAVSLGVQKATDGARAEYKVDSPVPILFAEDDVRIEGRKALVSRGPDNVRFAVPEGVYAQLVAGKIGVRGVGPFDLTISATNVTGTVAGRMRTLVVTKPGRIIRPMYTMDKVRWYAAYPDDPAPWRGRSDVQFNMAFGVADGRHAVQIKEWESPSLPPVPSRREVGVSHR